MKLVRQDFRRLLKGKDSSFLLEKTAANCLRLELVNKVFPNTKFIHILRDGRDVAVSTRRKYKGDIRKISSNRNLENQEGRRFRNFFHEIYHKINNGLTLLMLISNSLRYLRMSLVLLGLRKRDFWGPRFKGFRKLYRNDTLIEVASEQWKYSVNSILDFIAKNPNKDILTLKYEDLITSPNTVIKETMEFILDKNFREEELIHDIKTSGFETWKDVLNEKEELLVNTRLSDLLKQLDYE